MAGNNKSLEIAKYEASIEASKRRIKEVLQKIQALEREKIKIFEAIRVLSEQYERKYLDCSAVLERVSGMAMEKALLTSLEAYGASETEKRVSYYDDMVSIINKNVSRYEDEIFDCTRNINTMERNIRNGLLND